MRPRKPLLFALFTLLLGLASFGVAGYCLFTVYTPGLAGGFALAGAVFIATSIDTVKENRK